MIYATGSHRLLVQVHAENLPHKNNYFNPANGRDRIYYLFYIFEHIGYRYKRFLNIMRQNTNLINAQGLFQHVWFLLGYFCIYSRIYNIAYGIALISFEIRSLSPTINIAYGENSDFKTG